MILGFKKQFVAPIEEGLKIHSIREDKPNRWMAGRIIHMATGVRTKNYREFRRSVCVSVQRIKIVHSEVSVRVYVDDYLLGDCFIEREVINEPPLICSASIGVMRLATNDGFSDVQEFFNWFNEDFEGKIIHWTKTRY